LGRRNMLTISSGAVRFGSMIGRLDLALRTMALGWIDHRVSGRKASAGGARLLSFEADTQGWATICSTASACISCAH